VLETVFKAPERDAGLHLHLLHHSFPGVVTVSTHITSVFQQERQRRHHLDLKGFVVDLAHALHFPEHHMVSILEQMFFVFMHCHQQPFVFLADASDYTLSALLPVLVEVLILTAEVSETVAIHSQRAPQDEPDVFASTVVVDVDQLVHLITISKHHYFKLVIIAHILDEVSGWFNSDIDILVELSETVYTTFVSTHA
jgi:hypothetical protein